MRHRRQWIAWSALGAGVLVAPAVLPPAMATEILIFAIVAVAANLLIGYGGLFTFGQAMFFGVGGYTAGYLLAHYQVSLLTALLVGALAGGISAAVIGAICIRRVGLYFIMLTFAFNQMIYYIAYSWQSVTGGEDGMRGIVRPPIDFFGVGRITLSHPLAYYALVAVTFLVCFALMYRVVESPLGKIVIAARENNRRVASVGYNFQRAQILMFTISGVFTGLAGALYGMLYWIMPIEAVHWLNSAYIMFMVLIGGTSSPFGPVVGTMIFIALQDIFSTIWARWLLMFGAVVIGVVLFLQGGVIELLERVSAALQRRKLGQEEAGLRPAPAEGSQDDTQKVETAGIGTPPSEN
jgi:branched-chain amino acid transport system permease protein